MRLLIAPDSFKGSLTALVAAQSMGRGVQRVFPHAHIDLVPMADGGEGTVAAMVTATNGTLYTMKVKGPLGELEDSFWGMFGGGGAAVIEMAAASGLPMVPPDQRNPCITTTYGTGELIVAALEALHATPATGATKKARPKLMVGIGGSATNDGGTGAMCALGVRFLDAQGNDLPPGGAALAQLARIDASGIHPLLAKTDILVACDVDNPLCGSRGASAVFGPQKGATPEMVNTLDAALAHYAALATKSTGKDVANTHGAGAAGGLGAGFLFFTEAKLRPGVDVVLEASNFEEKVRGADFVLTGEGFTDFQTAFGKAPVGVGKAAKKHGKPVVCVSGGLGKGAADIFSCGIDALSCCICSTMPLEQCMAQAAPLLEDAVERVCKLLDVGRKLR